jgi:hypothetical protein
MELGWPAVAVVLALIFVVRPAAVAVGTAWSGLTWRERLFIAWIGPRGIVAAAVASFFAATFVERGMEGGLELRALVFLVIAITVLCAGLTGGIVARMLGLQRPRHSGWVILGANELGRSLGQLFRDDGQPVICIDSNMNHCRAAEGCCTSVIHGNGLDPHYLQLAEIDTRRGAIAVTGNAEVNYLFVREVKDEAREALLFSALEAQGNSLTVDMLRRSGVECLFAVPTDVERWNSRIEAGRTTVELWRCRPGPQHDSSAIPTPQAYRGDGLLGLAYRRGGRLAPLGDATRLKIDDEVYLLIYEPEREAVLEYLLHVGWLRTETALQEE